MSNKQTFLGTEDCPFTIIAKPHEYYCDFICYACWFQNDIPIYEEKNSEVTIIPTEYIDKASIYLHGSIKWDGCSNLYFDEQDYCMLHFCGRENSKKIDNLFAKLYELAKTLIPKWDGD